MAVKIKIRITSVKNANSKLPSVKLKVNNVKNGINSVRNNLQSTVKARFNVANSLDNIYRESAKIENSIQELYSTVNKCTDIYIAADDLVKVKARRINDWK